jgi:histidyl-tRNA synthetase
VRLWYLMPNFRYDRPQAGRYREHHQFGVEAIGKSDATVDAEVIELLWRFYEELGLTDLTLHLNSIGDGDCRPQYLEVLRDYYRDKLDRVCADCRGRFERNPLRLLDCKNPKCQPVIAGAPAFADYLCDACREHLEQLKRYLEAAGVRYRLNPRLVRGLDYYTRTVFEVEPREEGGQRSIGGGGRYRRRLVSGSGRGQSASSSTSSGKRCRCRRRRAWMCSWRTRHRLRGRPLTSSPRTFGRRAAPPWWPRESGR